MTITTTADLERVPIGDFVRVNKDRNQIFQRVERGFARDGVPLDLSAFSGALKAGLVETFDASIHPGDWFQHPGYPHRYDLVVNQTSHGWRVIRVRDGHFYAVTESNMSQLLTMTKADVPVTKQQALTILLESVQQLAEVVEPTLSSSQVADLHDFANNVDLEGFDDLLHQIGIGRGANHTIAIRITGTSTVTPDNKHAQHLLGDGFAIDKVEQGEVTVTWTKVVTVDRYGIGCQCHLITDDDVAPHLPPGTTAHTWTVSH
jgi:hypothetical protein